MHPIVTICLKKKQRHQNETLPRGNEHDVTF